MNTAFCKYSLLLCPVSTPQCIRDLVAKRCLPFDNSSVPEEAFTSSSSGAQPGGILLPRKHQRYKPSNRILDSDNPGNLGTFLPQFKVVLRAGKSPYALHPVSQKFPQRCLIRNRSSVRLNLTTAFSRPFKGDGLALPLSTPFSRRSMVCCPWLCAHR